MRNLLDRLKRLPMGSEESWCDYWRGFWDATRPLRKNPGRMIHYGTDRREYANGAAMGVRWLKRK